MKASDYCQYDATGLADLIRQKEVSQKEIARTVASAIDTLNPKINAVIETFDDRIESLPEFPENPDAPFAGVPWLLKDIGSGEVGRKQEQGSRLLKGYIVQEETHLARKMREAGLVNLGRTTVPECAYDGNTETILQGSTRNPWDVSRSAGGSSGGSSACVSSGIVPAAHASDGGGSIRLPASLNGLVGLKPTRGRISTWPIFVADRPLGHATEFMVCKTVRDVAGMLDAFNGPAPNEPHTLALPQTSFMNIKDAPLRRLKVAINWDNGGPCVSDPAVIRAIQSAAKALEGNGHSISEAHPDVDYCTFAGAMTVLWTIEIATLLDLYAHEMQRPLNGTTLEPNLLKLKEQSRSISGQNLMEAFLQHDACNRTFHEFLSDYDILITPTTCVPAPKLGQTGPFTKEPWHVDFAEEKIASICQYTFQANASGQPAISLPLGWTDTGLPIGIQIQARYGDEATLIQLAAFFEKAMPWSGYQAPLHFTNQA